MFSTKHPKTGLELNPGLHGQTPATNSFQISETPLEQSRQWTAFQLESNVYQFTAVPYGFKNRLAAFIRALEKVFGR